jgi:hypothetical protein
VAAGDRKLIDLTDDALRNTPAVARLACYDLPKLWKSRGYFGWLSDTDGEFGPYEDIATKDTTAAKPIVFSFDDIVLTAADLSPVKTPWTDTTRVAVFANTFAASPGAAKAPTDTGPQAAPTAGKPQKPTPKGRRWVNDRGVYNPAGGDGIHTSYFSQITLNTNYIADYPHWTRLVACEGNLFDVFDQRTPDHASNVVGARAAVRWVDAVTGRPANAVAARPGVTTQRFFAIEPLHELEHAQRFAQVQYNHGAPSTVRLGRFDLALLRCCDLDGSDERAVNLVYFRMNFAFPAPNATVQASYTTATPPQAVPANLAGNAQLKYAEDFVTNVAARWNGTDGKPPAARAQFLPSAAPAAPLKVDVVWFGQSLPLAHAQFACRIEVPAYRANPRSWFDGTNGKGELSAHGCAEEDSDGAGLMWFVGAHECGHGVGLNDDYCERWNAYSYGQMSLRWHMPGDPYEPDGRTVEFHQSGAAMMNGNIEVRNRYFWHIAEWARGVSNTAFKVKVGAYDDYQLPPHTNASRTYANWPMNASMGWQPDAANSRGQSSLLLYALGKDKYATQGLGATVTKPNTYDGILIAITQLRCTLPNWTTAATMQNGRKAVLQQLAAVVRDALAGMNGRFYVTGTWAAGTPQERSFSRCLLHFMPRFVVTNFHDAAGAGVVTNGASAGAAATLANNMGTDFNLNVVFSSTNPADGLWMVGTAAPGPLMNETMFKNTTGVVGGVRTPADHRLDTLGTQITAYHAIDALRLTERITALTQIINGTTAWLAAFAGGVAATARQPAVQLLDTDAKAWKAHLEALRRDRNLQLTYSANNELGPIFIEQYPSMLGVFKAAPDVVAADLTTLAQAALPGATVHSL